MTGQSADGDFTACDSAMLNKFFADYLKSHTQSGTNALQRLVQLAPPQSGIDYESVP